MVQRSLTAILATDFVSLFAYCPRHTEETLQLNSGQVAHIKGDFGSKALYDASREQL